MAEIFINAQVAQNVDNMENENTKLEASNNADKNNSKKSSTKKSDEKDYTPSYTPDKEKHLKVVTTIVEQEIRNVLDDGDYAATPIANGQNAYIDLKAFAGNGGILVTPAVNRTHGKDQGTTGKSIMSQGAHHPFIVVTKEMAEAAGIAYVRFANDQDKDKPIPPEARILVVLDGNGRTNFLMSIERAQWPDVNALFPQKNRAGYYDLPACMTCINTEISKWKTQDFVQKEILENQDGVHEGFLMINKLVREGYGYQSACQIATLGTDRILKTKINGFDAKDVFAHYESAVKIYEKLKDKFSKDDAPLKTKEFTKEISNQWKLIQKLYGDEGATKKYIDFLEESLTDDLVEEIRSAKSKSTESGKVSKDEVRRSILEGAFKRFTGKYDIKID